MFPFYPCGKLIEGVFVIEYGPRNGLQAYKDALVSKDDVEISIRVTPGSSVGLGIYPKIVKDSPQKQWVIGTILKRKQPVILVCTHNTWTVQDYHPGRSVPQHIARARDYLR